MALDEGAAVMRLLAGATAAAAAWVWWPSRHPVPTRSRTLIAMYSPRLHARIRAWNYLAPALAVVGAWSVGLVWIAGGCRWPVVGVLPAMAALPVRRGARPRGRRGAPSGRRPGGAVAAVAGDPRDGPLHGHAHLRRDRLAEDVGLHAPVRAPAPELAGPRTRASASPGSCWRSRATSASRCGHPQRRRARRGLRRAGHRRALALEPPGRRPARLLLARRHHPSLINQLFGRSKEPFWQQAYVNLVRWIIELHRMASARWVTLQDVYRCTLDPERIEAKITEVEALVEPPGTVRVRMAHVAPHGDELAAWSWRTAGGVALRMSDDQTPVPRRASSGLSRSWRLYPPVVHRWRRASATSRAIPIGVYCRRSMVTLMCAGVGSWPPWMWPVHVDCAAPDRPQPYLAQRQGRVGGAQRQRSLRRQLPRLAQRAPVPVVIPEYEEPVSGQFRMLRTK